MRWNLTQHIISDGRQWLSSWWLPIITTADQQYCPGYGVSLTDHRCFCFVHFISVEFSEYNIELVDLVDFRYLNSTLSDDRLDRSTRSTLGPSLHSTRLRPQTLDSIDRLDRFRGLEAYGVTSLTFGCQWRHQSRDHSSRHKPFPIDGPLEWSLYLHSPAIFEILDCVLRSWGPFRVTWGHRSRDRWYLDSLFICHFLLVVLWNQTSISNGFRDYYGEYDSMVDMISKTTSKQRLKVIHFGTNQFLADRTNGRAYATVLRLSSVVCLSVTLCIVAKRCVLEQKLLLRAYRKSYVRNRLVPKWMTLTFV